MAPPEKDFQCSHCAKTFKRAEHLRRHGLIHSQSKPFQCSGCPKSFIRRDALQRHELTHQAAPNLLQRGGRACSNCAAAKARCSGEKQCSRCRERASSCVYPQGGNANDLSPDEGNIGSPVHLSSYEFTADAMSEQGVPELEPGNLDFDFWDQNMLASTNWLDGTEFLDFPLPQTPSPHGTFLAPQNVSTFNGERSDTMNTLPPRTFDGQTPSGSPTSIFSPRSAAVTESNTSNTSYEGAPAEHGEYYVDGEPSRLPRIKRRKTSTAKRPAEPDTLIPRFTLQSTIQPGGSSPRLINISDTAYQHLQAFYQKLCLDPAPGWMAFELIGLPRKEVWEYLIGLYFTYFDPSVPFLHHTSLKDVQRYPLLILTMAAIGVNYLEDLNAKPLSTSMHEFARRLVIYQEESRYQSEAKDTLCEPGARLLHLVGMAYCGDRRLQKHATDSQRVLPIIFKEACREVESLTIAVGNNTQAWQLWVRRESAIRLAYSSWLLDSMWGYQLDCRPSLGLLDGHLPLPVNNNLWKAETEEDWKVLFTDFPIQPTLQEALQILYVDKHLPQDRGEFARILIIHGLYHRLWEVERYYSNPLSLWEPTANRQSSSELLPKHPIWLPGNPEFARWENSACDCLDILHWQANAKIGRASGLEHPTVMHLHFARVVLLTPYKEIATLARAMTSSAPGGSTAKHLIQRWAVQHQYKARLAAIHAGSLFWHVRRYSTDAFYEAPAVALSALVLWAFGTFASTKALSRSTSKPPENDPQQPLRASDESEQSDDAVCNIILLDRPTDDELVQQFIRNGHAMQAHITGVGDLYAAKGPERVLLQGIKLLSTLNRWGVGTPWLQLLEGLVAVIPRSRTG